MIDGKDGPAKAETSVVYWRAIKRVHLGLGVDLSFTNDMEERWRRGTERGVLETLGPRKKKAKAAFSFSQIKDMYDLDWSAYGGRKKVRPRLRILTLRAAGTLAIQAMFRASEYTSTSKKQFNPKTSLTRDMLEIYGDRQMNRRVTPTKANLQAMLRSGKGWALVKIPQLKNDQLMDKGFPPVVLTLHHGEFCPLRDLLLMEVESPMPNLADRQQAPLFMDPETGKQLTKTALGTVFKGLTKQVCFNKTGRRYSDKEIAKVWSLHSFRVTGQNWFRAAGAEPWEIKMAGRWLSDCYQKYTRADLARLGQLGANLQNDSAPIANLPGMTTYAYPYPSRILNPDLPSPGRNRVNGVGEFMLTAEDAQEMREEVAEATLEMTPTERNHFNTLITGSLSPKSLVGRCVAREFDGRWYSGKIPAHNNREGDEYVRVEYDDGDGESIHISEISEFLLEEEEEE